MVFFIKRHSSGGSDSSSASTEPAAKRPSQAQPTIGQAIQRSTGASVRQSSVEGHIVDFFVENMLPLQVSQVFL